MNKTLRWILNPSFWDRATKILPLIISCYSVWFSVHVFRAQFALDMRPFVGITNVQTSRSLDSTIVTAVIKNTGKLPATIKDLQGKWWILREGHPEHLAGGNDTQSGLFLFPGAEIKYSIPVRGIVHERYLKADRNGYTLHVQYHIQYAAQQIEASFDFNQLVVIENDDLSTLWVHGT